MGRTSAGGHLRVLPAGCRLRTAPSLPARFGIGPDSAAALLIAAGDTPERLGSEASFAALCGVSPRRRRGGVARRRYRPRA
ncbi:transposase [Streptomyces shenzhenensis]|uniref:transposase n=1 Tax=Streptomyces shenzhenensis TaxID=943815 RepID=UPI0037F7E06E